SIPALQWILEAAPLRSRIVLTGTFHENISFNPFVFIDRELDMIGAHQPKCPDNSNLFYPFCKKFNASFVLEQIRKCALRVDKLSDGAITPEELIPFYDSVRDGKTHLRQPIINWGGI
ncbi:MAG: hypothetical protein WAX69_01035, partial [Victivallales bacterium]